MAEMIAAADMVERVSTAHLQTLGMLVAGIAHELNTPLGALQSDQDVLQRALSRLTLILEDDVVDATELDEVRRIVRAIGEIQRVDALAVERMGKIVTGLRSFGRLDQAEIDVVDVHEGLESTLAILRHEITGRIAVVREFGELPPLKCHPHQLNQLFMNLLLNAAQSIRGEGTITIRTSRQGEEVKLEVEDTGVGIPEENLTRIFEPGFSTKDSRVGMGIGLLICHRIVEQHQGRISVRSRVGVGTTFIVQIPLV